MVTIKQLADLCGVSRGTVDRVLNNRGNVNPAKAAMIREMAEKMHYRPNPVGKALTARRKHPTVGIVMPSEGIAFFDDVVTAMQHAEEKYQLFGLRVIWRLTHGYDVAAQAAIIDELADEVNALIINPISDPCIVEKINACIKKDIFVVALNNDIEQADAHVYVGPDYRNGGETAGALLPLIGRGPYTCGVTVGSRRLLGHQQRLQGFTEAITATGENHVAAVWEDNDDDVQAYEATQRMLKAHPDINALFLASSGGTYGTCRAIRALHREQDITIIAFDNTPPTREMVEQHVIDAVLYQHPHQQGQKAMQLVYDKLINGLQPNRQQYIMQNEIRLLPNL